MSQITWQNINTPQFGQANSLMDAGAARITEGIAGLQTLANQKNTINEMNYQTGVENNTNALVNQLNRAGTLSELGGVDLASFGAQVDNKTIQSAFTNQRKVIQQAEQDAAKVKFEQDKFTWDRLSDTRKYAVDMQKANQSKFVDDRNGTIWATDPNTGNSTVSATYTKRFKPGKGKGKGNDSYDSSSIDSLVRTMAKNYPNDPEGYNTAVGELYGSLEGISTKQVNAKVGNAAKYYTGFFAHDKDTQLRISEQANLTSQAVNTATESFAVHEQGFKNLLDAPIDRYLLSQDSTVKLAAAQETYLKETEGEAISPWFGFNISGDRIVEAFIDKFNRQPTGAEFIDITRESRKRYKDNTVTFSGNNLLDKVLTDYKSVTGDSKSLKIAQDIMNLKNSYNATINNAATKLNNAYTRDMEAHKSGTYEGKGVPALRKLDTSALDDKLEQDILDLRKRASSIKTKPNIPKVTSTVAN